MSRILKKLIQFLLVGYFVFNIFKGFVLPTNYIYIIALFLIFSFTIFLSSIILNFLTIKENFITTLLMSSLLCIGVFFLVEGFMPGFQIEQYTFEGLDTGNLVVNSFEVTKILTMIFASVTFSFITSILNVLEKNA